MSKSHTPIELREQDRERFWAKVNRNGPIKSGMDTPCWEWKVARFHFGHGVFKLNRKQVKASRVAWALANGPIPDALCVLHRCDNPGCVRVEHLFLGTQEENVRDRDTKGRGARGECHYYAKLTARQVVAIRCKYAAGRTLTDLGRSFGVTKQAIAAICRRETWRHL